MSTFRLQSKLTLLIAILGVFMTGSANAYLIQNATDKKLYVLGESCQACFRRWIEAGGEAACPGNNDGCRGTTYISVRTKVEPGPNNGRWYFLITPKPVTAHGVVYISKIPNVCFDSPESGACVLNSLVDIRDDNGNLIYKGPMKLPKRF